MRIPVLTYHASTVAGNSYPQNDHIALAEDLKLIHSMGLRVVPLDHVVDHLLGIANHDLSKAVVLTCDDGCDLEIRDVLYPGFGIQIGFLNVMKQAHREFGWRPTMTSFVIADPVAREKMDAECLYGQNWLSESWWNDSEVLQYFTIGTHGWDHNHPVLGDAGFDGMSLGSFFDVNTLGRAEYQLRQSIDYINRKIKPARCRFFAYPYGHVPDYLRINYLPGNSAALGLQAAFGTQAGCINSNSDIWNLPRYVCGWHWKSSDELQAILVESQ